MSLFHELPSATQARLRREAGGDTLSIYVPLGRPQLNVAEVHRLVATGLSVAEVARRLGVSRQAVYEALKR